MDDFELIKHQDRESYVAIYIKLREFYMAERNFMLTGSTLLVLFILWRFLAAFKKLYDLEQ